MAKPYPEKECTWYVAGEWKKRFESDALYFPFPPARHAKRWLELARQNGLQTGAIPTVGAVVVWENGTYGHVALVEEVLDNGERIRITEYNMVPKQWSERTISAYGSISGYIYPPTTSTTTPVQDTEFEQAWDWAVQNEVFSTFTKKEDTLSAERLAVVLKRFYDLISHA